jgi:hypothetical protein
VKAVPHDVVILVVRTPGLVHRGGAPGLRIPVLLGPAGVACVPQVALVAVPHLIVVDALILIEDVDASIVVQRHDLVASPEETLLKASTQHFIVAPILLEGGEYVLPEHAGITHFFAARYREHAVVDEAELAVRARDVKGMHVVDRLVAVRGPAEVQDRRESTLTDFEEAVVQLRRIRHGLPNLDASPLGIHQAEAVIVVVGTDVDRVALDDRGVGPARNDDAHVWLLGYAAS